ncbi:RNA cytosine C(5)-methyltransferase NSUN2 [Oncorhynchus mykiss]|uniref:RNA cytosine C(5)-methyltransferase NSUN2 n=1 Tax=Oncorhynchus mykiss TaxID=8022 RepID=UPI000B4EBB57|nr:RNA cytosine C(5)-methyltransferase NSUN2 [Oncorhynchus mykiss]
MCGLSTATRRGLAVSSDLPRRVSTLFPYIRSRMIIISVEDIKILLTQENPYLNKLEDDAHQQAKKIEMGSIVLKYRPDSSVL